MRARAGSSAVAILALALVTVLTTSCATPSNNLDGDPCLLQQYQKDNVSVVHTIQSALSTVTSASDALAPQAGSINATQDISETLTALTEFQLSLSAQWNMVRAGAMPTDSTSTSYRTALHKAIQSFAMGTTMLTQAYVDVENADPLTAKVIVTAARSAMHRGRVLLAQANSDLSALKTYSANC